jgi:hypothetical protein
MADDIDVATFWYNSVMFYCSVFAAAGVFSDQVLPGHDWHMTSLL